MTNSSLYKKQCTIFNSLFDNNNIHDIVDCAENTLKNPIFILDTSYRVITRSNLAEKVNSSIEIHNGKCYLIDNLIKLMSRNKCIDSLYNVDKSFLYKDESNKQELIFCPIKINNLTAFYICILKINTNFTADHLELTNTLSKVLAIQIERDNIFISNSGYDYEYYLTDLLLNKIDDINYIQKRFNNTEFKPLKYFVVLTIPFKQNSTNYNHNFAVKELFRNIKNIFMNCIFTYYEEKIVFLFSSDAASVITENEYKRFSKFLSLNKLSCGISMNFTNILETGDFFNQAVFASSLCQKNNLAFFNDHIDKYLFSNCDENIKLPTLIHPAIRKLKEYDSEHSTDLLKTLEIYLNNNRNVNATSSSLNIHRSTFFYRFHRIEEIINTSLETDNMLFKLELSFKILDYLLTI